LLGLLGLSGLLGLLGLSGLLPGVIKKMQEHMTIPIYIQGYYGYQGYQGYHKNEYKYS